MKKIIYYILTIKDFEVPELPKDIDFVILNLGKEKLKKHYRYKVINCDYDPLQLSNNEWTGFKHIYDNCLEDSEYIGICHYRRYPEFFPNDELLENYKMILPVQTYVVNIFSQFSSWHNINDLMECANIMANRHPDYNYNSEFLYTNNCLITSNNEFKKWYEEISTILTEYYDKHNYKTSDDIIKYVTNNKEKYHCPPCKIEYQSRIGGFIAERLNTIYFRNNFKNTEVFHIQIKQTDLEDTQAPKFEN